MVCVGAVEFESLIWAVRRTLAHESGLVGLHDSLGSRVRPACLVLLLVLQDWLLLYHQ